jgi:subtilisin family serine protease
MLILTLLVCPVKARAQDQRPRVPGELLLQYRTGATAQQVPQVTAAMGQFQLTFVDSLLDGAVEHYRAPSVDGVGAEEAMANALMATGAFAFVEPNYLVEPAVIPDDPSFVSQWHHATIRSSEAWDHVATTRSVLIVVCDGGFDPTHRDLIDNLVLPGYNVVDGTTNIASTLDHGTQVTGVIAAVGNNTQDVAGVSWEARVLPVRISNRSDGVATFSDIARCIEYAAFQGARVVNISYSNLYIGAAIDVAAGYFSTRGGVFVGAAGNNAADLRSYPNSPNMLLVGATTQDDRLASFSNFGGPVDLVAPGVGVVTTINPALFGRTVAAVSGTSFASPIVAGVAALVLAIDSDFTPTDVEDILLSTARDLGEPGPDEYFAQGRVDAGAAVAEAVRRATRDGELPTLSLTRPADDAIVKNTITLAATATDNVGVTAVAFWIDESYIAQFTDPPYRVTFNTWVVNNGWHNITVGAFDAAGNSRWVSVRVLVNNNDTLTLDNLVTGSSDARRTFTGAWCAVKEASSWGNPSLNSCGAGDDTYRFTPRFLIAGERDVFIRYTAGANRSPAVPLTIVHGAGTTVVNVNMQVQGSTWVYLGRFPFEVGTPGFVQVDDSNGRANVDGIRFVLIR